MNKGVAVTTVLAAAVVGWYWLNGPEAELVQTGSQDMAQPKPVEEASSEFQAAKALLVANDVTEEIAGNNDEAIQMMMNHQAFQQEMQDFLTRGDAAKDPESVARLQKKLDELVNQELVTPFEELMIRLAFLKHTTDEATFEAESAQLMADYESLVELERAATKPDPRHMTYKEKERQIMQEVLSMDEYPDGLSRDDYLKQRLDQVRSEVYSLVE